MVRNADIGILLSQYNQAPKKVFYMKNSIEENLSYSAVETSPGVYAEGLFLNYVILRLQLQIICNACSRA
jgi:hypothetical protein